MSAALGFRKQLCVLSADVESYQLMCGLASSCVVLSADVGSCRQL